MYNEPESKMKSKSTSQKDLLIYEFKKKKMYSSIWKKNRQKRKMGVKQIV